MEKEFKHIPVLLEEAIDFLDLKQGGVYVDATLGGGGHARKIAEIIGEKGKIIAIDRDQEAIDSAKKNLTEFESRILFAKGNFRDLDKIFENFGIKEADGFLFDLGVSTYQLENPERGFSFSETGENLNSKLDMRMDRAQELTAQEIINNYREEQLEKIFQELGEEKYARKIARKIVEARQNKKIETIGELLEIIRAAVPAKYIFGLKKGHFSSRVFRALRMEVNQELPSLEESLPKAFNLLKIGGRLVVISFHSLEDRIVKNFFKEILKEKNGKGAVAEILTKKPLTPSKEEILQNPNSHSAKLRAVERIF